MPEVAYDERIKTQGTYELINNIDKNVQEVSNNLYDFKRDANGRFSRIEADINSVQKDLTDLKITTGVTQHEVTSLKEDVKDIHRDLTDIKGSIRELSGSFSAMQTRFNWGLVILGIIIALIQFWKG